MAPVPIAMTEVLEQPMVTFSADEVRAPPRKSPHHRENAALDEPKTDEEYGVVNIMLSPAKRLLMR